MAKKVRNVTVKNVAVLRYKIRGQWTIIRIEDAEFEYVGWTNEQEITKTFK